MLMQNLPPKCMAVENFSSKKSKIADSRHLENWKIAVSYDDAEWFSQSHRLSPIHHLGFKKITLTSQCT